MKVHHVRIIAANSSFSGIAEVYNYCHRYKEDIKNTAWMGLGAFRFSIEWAHMSTRKANGIGKKIKYFSEAFPGKAVYIIESDTPAYNGKHKDNYKKKVGPIKDHHRGMVELL